MAMGRTATPQETYDHMLGAGAFEYSWWVYIKETTTLAADSETVTDWSARLGIEDGNGDLAQAEVSHASILRTARKVMGGAGGASSACRAACRDLVFDADDCDFDAGTADELLQIATLGEAIYS